ncbi:MAG: carbonic anhydrase [Nannocystaceae bacterium]
MNIEHLLAANAAWADARRSHQPDFFHRLAAGQAPTALWIGCADSRVPPDHIIGSDPGTLFVHRNVANIVSSGDLNLMSVLEYATTALKVRDIFVCGHESCGGVAAALDGPPDGVLRHWLSPIERLAQEHQAELKTQESRAVRIARLVELNVRRQVQEVSLTPPVLVARARGQSLTVHGFVFHLSTGLLEDLDCGSNGLSS